MEEGLANGARRLVADGQDEYESYCEDEQREQARAERLCRRVAFVDYY